MNKLILKSAGIAMIVIAIFFLVINPFTTKEDEAIVLSFFGAIFVAWALLSGFLYLRADEEWKMVNTAVLKGDYETFRVEAPKRIPESLRTLYVVVSGITVLSSLMVHTTSWKTTPIVLFISFIVPFFYQVINDLDNPMDGVVNVENVPKDWLEKLKPKDG